MRIRSFTRTARSETAVERFERITTVHMNEKEQELLNSKNKIMDSWIEYEPIKEVLGEEQVIVRSL